jgi:hypothetical protein
VVDHRPLNTAGRLYIKYPWSLNLKMLLLSFFKMCILCRYITCIIKHHENIHVYNKILLGPGWVVLVGIVPFECIRILNNTYFFLIISVKYGHFNLNSSKSLYWEHAGEVYILIESFPLELFNPRQIPVLSLLETYDQSHFFRSSLHSENNLNNSVFY